MRVQSFVVSGTRYWLNDEGRLLAPESPGRIATRPIGRIEPGPGCYDAYSHERERTFKKIAAAVRWLVKLHELPSSADSARVTDDNIPTSPKEGTMATKTVKRGGAKKSGAKRAATNGRITGEERDALSARVVEMRDEQEKSWGDIADELELAPSRLRALYNHGGGQARPRTAKKGSKAAPKPAGKRVKKGTKVKDPS